VAKTEGGGLALTTVPASFGTGHAAIVTRVGRAGAHATRIAVSCGYILALSFCKTNNLEISKQRLERQEGDPPRNLRARRRRP